MIVFGLALSVSVGAYGLSVWSCVKRPRAPKLHPNPSSRAHH